jgi:hypothetical protein
LQAAAPSVALARDTLTATILANSASISYW